MKTFYLYSILLLLGCSACKTDSLSPKEGLPDDTQQGLNTFGCLVNGEVWLPKAPFLKNKLVYEYSNGLFSISADKIDKNFHQAIGIRIEENLNSPIAYNLESYPEHKATFFDLERDPPCFYDRKAVKKGELKITKLDTANHIIAGTFAFTVWTEGCDTIKVTDGRFDLKYAQ